MVVEFSDPDAGQFSSTLSVEALLSGEMAKLAENLDSGTKIPSLRGYLTYDKDWFCYIQLKKASFTLPESAKRTNAIDPNKVTGADLVRENAAKENGYSESQLRKICEILKGRKLEFENGKVSNVWKCRDGTVSMVVDFLDSGSRRAFSHDLSVDIMLDGEMARLAETLDRGTKILKASGTVSYDSDFFTFMKLTNAVFTPESSVFNRKAVDYANVTGSQLIAENASKRGGYSNAQLSNICRQLDGHEITFTSGTVTGVEKSARTGGVTLSVNFQHSGDSSFSPSMTVHAKLAEGGEAKAIALNKGASIASLTGKVVCDGFPGSWMELADATFEANTGGTADMTFNPDTVTGADIVKANAATKGGFSKVQIAAISKQLDGRALMFENAEIRSVSKNNRRGGVRVLFSVSAPDANGSSPSLTVWAYMSGDMAAEVEKLDVGTKVKWVRGRVTCDSSFELSNASFGYGDGMAKGLSETAKRYLKSAEQGDAKAQYNLGVCYAKGEGVEKDPVEAMKWFGKSAEQGVAQAQCALGVGYAKGKGVEANHVEAVKWFRMAAEQGNAIAQNSLGVCYAKGEGVEKDPVEAVKWYRKAAEQGNAVAQSNLGRHYNRGDGVEKDPKEGAKWLFKAAEQGYAEAQFYLGTKFSTGSYTAGKGEAEDQKEAAKWLRKAAEQGHAKAQSRLGSCYLFGRGVTKNVVEAAKWYDGAMEQGAVVNSVALRSLARHYDRGRDVEKDKEEATRWYRKAAEQGDELAQLWLGERYEKGDGVKQDMTEAVKWYRKAAEQGNFNAQYTLARCYETGSGVLQDLDEAVKWYRKAAKSRWESEANRARDALRRLGREP